ncbi:MAG: SRPBCC family protein [Thiohalospira sp.]
MKILKWLVIVIVCLIALFLIIPLFLPSNYHVKRSIIIDMPVNVVFQTAIDMNLRAKWDPWIEMDPDAVIVTEVTPKGIGSWYTWDGDIIGKGKLTIEEVEINKKINSKIEFIEPQSMTSDIEWTFLETKEGTEITWAFKGKLSYPVEKWFGLFLEKQLGPQFEKGLNNFKNLVESLPPMGKTGQIKEIEFNGLMAMAIKEECELKRIRSKMIEMYSTILNYLNTNGVEMSGMPIALYHTIDKEGYILLECGLPVNKKIKGNDRIKLIEIPAGKAITASHFGPYHTVKYTYEAVENYLSEKNMEISGSPWEMYLTDPLKEPDQSKWETKVYFPIN